MARLKVMSFLESLKCGQSPKNAIFFKDRRYIFFLNLFEDVLVDDLLANMLLLH